MFPTEIIVGVDGSAGSSQALRWAAREAAYRGVDLVVLHVYDWRIYGAASPIGARFVTDARGAAEAAVQAAIGEVSAFAPTVRVRGEALLGGAGPTLVAGSGNGAMTVVGSRGRNGFASLVLGSVSQQVATHAAGPVVVVRGRSDPKGPVVVGADGSAGADEALRLAFEEAAVRGIGVLAVRVYHPAEPPWGLGELPYVEDASERREAERCALAEEVAPWHDKFPDVPVETVALDGHPAEVLAGVSGRASLLVVGTRGRGGFASLLLGSVGVAVLHHADCPVMIARRHEGLPY
jgi:nucleotide-binding universal stress UspA family protein